MPRYAKARSRFRRRASKRARRYTRKKTFLKRARYRRKTVPKFLVGERKEFNAGNVSVPDSPGTPIARISVIATSPSLNVASGHYFIGYSRTAGTGSFFPNIARGVNHFDRIGREIIITSMHLRMRFTQQRATVNPMMVRVIVFRQLNEMLTTADYNPYRLMETNKLENPWFIDSESRYDKDEVKKMHILHDRKYLVKGDTVPTTLKIGSVSTPGDGDINEDKRQWQYRDVNIYKKLNLRIRYNDDDETAGPPAVRDVNTNYCLLVLADTGNCGGLPYLQPSPHQMPAASGLHMMWDVKWTFIDP